MKILGVFGFAFEVVASIGTSKVVHNLLKKAIPTDGNRWEKLATKFGVVLIGMVTHNVIMRNISEQMDKFKSAFRKKNKKLIKGE